MTRVGADDQDTAGKQEVKRFAHSNPCGFPPGGDSMIPSGQPAEVEYGSTDGLRHMNIQMLVTAAEKPGTFRQVFLPEQQGSRYDRLFLNIKSIDTA